MFQQCTSYGCHGVFLPATGHIFSAEERACSSCMTKFDNWHRIQKNKKVIRLPTRASQYAVHHAGRKIRVNGYLKNTDFTNSYFVVPRPYLNPKPIARIVGYILNNTDSVVVEFTSPEDQILSYKGRSFFLENKVVFVSKRPASAWIVLIDNIEILNDMNSESSIENNNEEGTENNLYSG